MKCFRIALALTVAAMALGVGNASAAEKPKLAMILKTLSAPYWQIVVAGAKEAAEKNGAELVVLGPPTEDAVEQQINMVQDVLAQKPDALIFSPSQPPTAVGVLNKFAKAKIPVILVDTGMPEGFTDYVTFIGTDNFAAGKAGGEALAKVMKKGEKVLLLDGAPGNPAMTDSCRWRQGGAVMPQVSSSAPASRPTATASALSPSRRTCCSRRRTCAGVFAGNDDEALGAMRALKQGRQRRASHSASTPTTMLCTLSWPASSTDRSLSPTIRWAFSASKRPLRRSRAKRWRSVSTPAPS